MGKFARPVAPLVNSLISTKPAKVVMDVMLDIDRNRAFPKYQSRGFRGWFKKEARAAQDCYRNQLAYFHGCSTEYQHPEVGKAFVQVMNAVGWGVRLLKEKCCGVAMISNGLWSQVARNANHNIAEFRKAVSRGLPIVATASTCTLTMRDEYPHILGIDNADVRDHITLVEKFLFEKLDAGEIRLVFKNDYRARIVYHIPCHMEKLGWSIFTEELIRMIPGVSLTVLDSGCCGIAGTYGFKKENYASSQAIGKSVFDQINALSPILSAANVKPASGRSKCPPPTKSSTPSSSWPRPLIWKLPRRESATIDVGKGKEIGRTVSGFCFKSAIYLRDLPPGIRRAAFGCRYIWSCRLRDRTRKTSLPSVVGSYPAFSPLQECPAGPGGSCGSFLLRPPCDCSHPGFPRRSALPCPDFPHRFPGAADRPASLLSRMQM